MKKSFPVYISDFILTVILSYSISLSLLTSLTLNVDSLTLIIFLVFFTFVYSLSYFLSNKTWVLILSFGILIFLLSGLFTRLRAEAFRDYIVWLVGFMARSTYYNESQIIFTISVVASFTTFFIYLFSVVFRNYLPVITAAIIMFLVQWYLGWFLSFSAFYCFLFLMPVLIYSHVYYKGYKKFKKQTIPFSKYSFLLIPICLICLFISQSLPVLTVNNKYQDEQRESINTFFENILEKLGLLQDGTFDLNLTGFSPNSSDKLGGNIIPNNSLALKVKSSQPVYLRGSVKEIYTGKGWKSSDNIRKMTDITNLLSLNKANLKFDNYNRFFRNPSYYSNTERPFSMQQIEIEHAGIRTKTLFVPAIPVDFSSDFNTGDISVKANGTIEMLQRIEEGSKYTFTSILINKNYPYLSNLISNISKMSREFSATGYSDPDNNVTELPSELPSRVYDLAKNITEGKTDNYEKAKAIEKYLSENYKYTTTPGNPPSNRDFVDYFLFDKKEGYCTYYASAMVVLCRAVDIPARYAEGFKTPATHTSGDIYEVHYSDAHAWPEVYINGIGWLAFEPTSAFNDNTINSIQNTGNTPTPAKAPDSASTNTQLPTPTPSQTSADSNQISQSVNLNWLVWFLVLILVIGIASIVIFFKPWNHFILRKIKNSPDKLVIYYYNKFLKILSKNNFEMSMGETPLQFAFRVDKELDLEGQFTKITEIYNKASYSDQDISKLELEKIKSFDLKQKIKLYNKK